MACKFGINTSPYSKAEVLFKKDLIEINPGVTVFTGCNGSGKSTLIQIIKNRLESSEFPFMYYNCSEQQQGEAVLSSISSSQGEYAYFRFSSIIQFMKPFFEMETNHSSRWVLIDGIDSYLSVDRIAQIRKCFDFLVHEAKRTGVELFIIVASNSFEMCKGSNCFSVIDGEYRDKPYDTYEGWHEDIMDSSEYVRKRIESLNTTT